jgi:hypothetical protein
MNFLDNKFHDIHLHPRPTCTFELLQFSGNLKDLIPYFLLQQRPYDIHKNIYKITSKKFEFFYG